MFDNQLAGDLLASAPKLTTDKQGKNYWEYQGHLRPSVGLNAVVGRPFEEYGMEPTSLDQLRDGCWDVHKRIEDMDVNGIAATRPVTSGDIMEVFKAHAEKRAKEVEAA